MAYFYPRPPRGGRLPYFFYFVKRFLFLSTPSARRATNIMLRAGQIWEISIHALREEGDVMLRDVRSNVTDDFYPRPPRGGRRSPLFLASSSTSYFYPRPPRGGRRDDADRVVVLVQFLSTPSARRATGMTRIVSWYLFNFYPRPPRGGRLSVWLLVKRKVSISIHALREEGDFPFLGVCGRAKAFLSTPSARRATRTPSV